MPTTHADRTPQRRFASARFLLCALALLAGCRDSASEPAAPPDIAAIVDQRYPGSALDAALSFVDEPLGETPPGVPTSFEDERIAMEIAQRLRTATPDRDEHDALTERLVATMLDAQAPRHSRRRAIFVLAAADSVPGRAALLAEAAEPTSVGRRYVGLRNALVESVVRLRLSNDELETLLTVDDPPLLSSLLYATCPSGPRPPVARRLPELLAHESAGVRDAATFVLTSAALETGVADPRLLLQLEQAEQRPGGRDDHGGAPLMTVGEWCVHSTVHRLARDRRGNDILRSWVGTTSSPLVRDLAAAGLARHAGDDSQRDALRAICRRSDRPNVRVAAVDGLGTIGEETDVALLEELASSDPEVAASCTGDYHLVRRAADEALERLRSRTATRSTH